MTDTVDPADPPYIGGVIAKVAQDYFRKPDLSQKKVMDFVMSLADISSTVELGSSSGRWTREAMNRGVTDIRAFDLHEVPEAELLIPADAFSARDLGLPLDLGRKYDLAISTEVAEHVTPKNVFAFIANICNASDLVLFSAAIPYQGGEHHQNEMWAEYWAKIFAAHGFDCFDILRMRFWNDGSIRSFYRQNLFIYARGDRAEQLRSAGHNSTEQPLSLVHPEQYLKHIAGGLPPEARRAKDDTRLYYDAVTTSPEQMDAAGRHHYGADVTGWDAVLAQFGE